MITVTEPITELTAEVIKGMYIHTTLASLRRACAVKESKVVPATETVPQLVYVTEADGTFSIHALSTDLTRYLMLQSIVDSAEAQPTEGQD